ncbi:MAG: hypothetical protein HY906_20845 [Deltaproteobacteria bacterium]|nr:hypothetical protein [Deltaproteobacteria bacterium]
MDYRKLATDFAAALVARDFSRAYAMTSSSYRAQTTLPAMQHAFEETVRPIEPLGDIHLMNTMEAWPAKRADDVGWAYVAIDGSWWGEAVAVVITRESGTLRIREVEWGRP